MNRKYRFAGYAIKHSPERTMRLDELIFEVKRFIDDENKQYVIFSGKKFHKNLQPSSLRLSLLSHFNGIFVVVDNKKNVAIIKLNEDFYNALPEKIICMVNDFNPDALIPFEK